MILHCVVGKLFLTANLDICIGRWKSAARSLLVDLEKLFKLLKRLVFCAFFSNFSIDIGGEKGECIMCCTRLAQILNVSMNSSFLYNLKLILGLLPLKDIGSVTICFILKLVSLAHSIMQC